MKLTIQLYVSVFCTFIANSHSSFMSYALRKASSDVSGKSYGGVKTSASPSASTFFSRLSSCLASTASSNSSAFSSTSVSSSLISPFGLLGEGLRRAAIKVLPDSLTTRYSGLSALQRLSTTPLYYVSSSQGHPYIQEDVQVTAFIHSLSQAYIHSFLFPSHYGAFQSGQCDQKVIVYFMSSEDCNDYLSEMAQGNPQHINDFRMSISSMEKVKASIFLSLFIFFFLLFFYSIPSLLTLVFA